MFRIMQIEEEKDEHRLKNINENKRASFRESGVPTKLNSPGPAAAVAVAKAFNEVKPSSQTMAPPATQLSRG